MCLTILVHEPSNNLIGPAQASKVHFSLFYLLCAMIRTPVTQEPDNSIFICLFNVIPFP